MAPSKAEGARLRLRELLGGPGLVTVPGVTNVLDALSAERAGFEAVFVTGAGVANAQFGLPDIGLLTMTETVEVTRRVARGVGIPVIADADTGYGNHLNVMRTVTEFEAAGAAAIVLEDQVAPKKCGHLAGKRVAPPHEMVEKLVAARHARTDPGLVLVARTDAVAIEGFASALERARLYASAGADVIFVEAPRTVEDLAEIPKAIALPCLVNMVEGGLTPLLGNAELEQLGFKIALYANVALRVSSSAVDRAFASLRETGSTAASIDRMLSWDDRQRAVDLPGWQALEDQIAEETREITELAQMTEGGSDGDHRA